MSWESRQRDVETATKEELANFLYDWDCGMCSAFNGSPYPPDYPRASRDVGGYRKGGKHLTFRGFKNYCESVGVFIEE